ncbi:MAG TPA: MFS transporter [Chloroflexi bacterium]|nr:MFS transporter [Chloroflexota bacterium]
MTHRSFSKSPALRGSAYYAVFFGVVGMYFAYVNVVFIQRGLSGVEIGLINAVSAAMILISSPLLTALADRTGWHRPILAIAHLFFGAAIFTLHFTTSFPLILAIVAVGSFCSAPASPLSDMLVVRMAARHDLDFGHMRLWGSLGFTAVCLLSGVIWNRIGFGYLFLAGGVLFALRSFSVLLLEPISKAAQPTADAPPVKFFDLLRRDHTFLIFLLATALWSSCWNGFFVYASIYMDQLGGSSFLLGLMMALTALGEVPSVFFADRLVHRLGSLKTTIIGIVFFLIVLAVIPFITNTSLLAAVNGLRGIGFGLWIVAGVRFVDHIAPDNYHGTYQGLFSLMNFNLPVLIALPLLGYLFDNVSIQSVFQAQLVLGVASLFIFLLLQRRMKNTSQTSPSFTQS